MAISNASSGFRPGVCTSTTRPTSPFNGQVIYETDTKQTLVWQGTAWVMLTDADTPPAMQLVKTQTVGTGVASVTVSNCFNADYENYKIVYSGGQSSLSPNLSIQLTVGGTPSTASYYGTLVWANVTNAVVSGAGDNNVTQWSWAGGGNAATDGSASLNVELLNPFDTKRTRIHNAQVVYNVVYGTYTGIHDLANSYDGIKIIPSSGTITGGTIRVYGYRNTI